MSSRHPRLANDRYIIQRCIGRGGMGAVFLARDQVLQGPRAIKVLDPSLLLRPDARARFRTEAIAMSQLNHPGVVRVYDHGQEGMTAFIVMEYVPGGSLRPVLESRGVLTPDEALSVCLDVADGLAHAHEQGIIHRDVKPDNILLGDRCAKLTDFGIARMQDNGDGLTRTSARLGTPAFMPPEQRLDSKRCTPRSDLYSLGATLYVLLTNNNPIDLYEPDARERMLSSLPPDVAGVIRKAVQANPADRFDSAEALAEALNGARVDPAVSRLQLNGLDEVAAPDADDLDALNRLWNSYVTPSHDAHSVRSESAQRTFHDDGPTSEDRVDGSVSQSTMAESLAPATAFEPAPASPPTSPPTSWAMRGMLAAVFCVAVGGVAFWLHDAPEELGRRVQVERAASTDTDRAVLAALMAADLDGVRTTLDDGTDVPASTRVLAESILAVLEQQPGAAIDVMMQAERDASAQADALAPAMVLARQTMDGTLVGDARTTRWRALLDAEPSTEARLLHAMSMLVGATPDEAAAQASEYASLKPDVPLFALLARAARPPAGSWAERGRTEDALAQRYPDSPAVLAARVRHLLETGRMDAAAEAIRSVALAGSVTALLLRADRAVLIDDDSEWNTALTMVFDDNIPPRLSLMFLRAHGQTRAGVGQLHEARKLWSLARVEAQKADLPAVAARILLAELEASVWLGDRSDETRFDVIQAQIETAPRGPGWKGDQRARLLFLDARWAAAQGDGVLVQRRVDQLRALDPSTRTRPARAVMLEVLELAADLADDEQSPAQLLARSRSGSPAASAQCAWLGLRAWAAQRAESPSVLRDTTRALVEGRCAGSWAERELTLLGAIQRLDALALGTDTTETLGAALSTRRDRWLAADEDLAFRTGVLAAAGASPQPTDPSTHAQ